MSAVPPASRLPPPAPPPPPPRTSTASARSQCSPGPEQQPLDQTGSPVGPRKLRIRVFPAGPQPQRTSEDIPDRMPERMSECQNICQKVCQNRCQIECQKECQSMCQKEWLSRWYVRNYVRIMDQGGDHSKKVIIGVNLEYLGGSDPLLLQWTNLMASIATLAHYIRFSQGFPRKLAALHLIQAPSGHFGPRFPHWSWSWHGWTPEKTPWQQS